MSPTITPERLYIMPGTYMDSRQRNAAFVISKVSEVAVTNVVDAALPY